jgi:hypothetical protein
MRIARVVSVVAVLLFSLVGCKYDLSEPPPRAANPSQIEQTSSRIGATISLAFSDIQSMANELAPKIVKIPDGNGGDVCATIGLKVCAGTRYQEMFIERIGLITVTRPADNHDIARIQVPLGLRGKVGFRGDGARLLGLDNKNVKAKIRASMDLRFDIDSKWCPLVSTNVGFDYLEPARLEVLRNVWVDVSGYIQGKLKEELDRFADDIKRRIDCSKLANSLQKIWSTRSFPVELTSGEQVFVNIEPKSMGFTGLMISDTAMSFGVILDTRTELSTSRIKEEPRPLPPLRRIKPEHARIDLHIPLRASYTRLVESLNKRLANREFSSDTPSGKVRVIPQEFAVYPSNNHVVVGVRMTADLPSRLLDTKGWVYLFGTPELVSGGQAFRVSHVGFARKLDNYFWEVATVLFESQINQEIEKATTIDLRPEYQKALESLNEDLTRQDPESVAFISLKNPELLLQRVQILDQELAVIGRFRADATILPNKDYYRR